MADPLSVPCPYCGARNGEKCMARTDYWMMWTEASRPHKARIKAAEEKSDA